MLKTKIIKIIIIFLLISSLSNISLATQEEILESQSETLNIKGFVEEANKYTEDVFTGIDTNDLMNDAIKGEIDNKTLIDKILNIFGKEIKQTLRIIRKYYCHYCNT